MVLLRISSLAYSPLFLFAGETLSWLYKSSSYSAIAENWEVRLRFIGSFVSFSCSISTYSSNYTFLRAALDELSGEATGLGDFLPDSMFKFSLLGDEGFSTFLGDEVPLVTEEFFFMGEGGFFTSLSLAELVETPLSLGVLKSLSDFSSSISDALISWISSAASD